MSKVINKNVMNVIFITFFSLAIPAQFIVPNNIVLNYWFPIFSVFFFISAFPYLNSLKVFITLVITSWIASFIIVKLVFGHFYGYDIVFILIYFKIFSVSSIAGFIAAKFCAYFVEKNLFNKNKLLLFGTGTISVLVIVISFIFFDSSSGNKIEEEVKKRRLLAENISVYYNQSRNRHINNQVVIQEKLIKNLYLAKEKTISHGYNGDITISSDDLGISLVYEGIPADEACYMFYFFDSPSTYGFGDTFVNDALVQSRVNYKSIKNGKAICYESDNKVTIRYTGSYAELEQASKYFD